MEGGPEEKRLLGRRRCVLDYNVKVYLQGEGWICIDLIDLVMDRDGVVGSCECGDETPGCIKARNFLLSHTPVSFLGRILLHGVSFLVI